MRPVSFAEEENIDVHAERPLAKLYVHAEAHEMQAQKKGPERIRPFSFEAALPSSPDSTLRTSTTPSRTGSAR